MDEQLWGILVCPDDHSRLHVADRELVARINEAIAAGRVKNRSGRIAQRPIDGGLVRDDGPLSVSLQDGIPVLLVDEAIPLEPIESA